MSQSRRILQAAFATDASRSREPELSPRRRLFAPVAMLFLTLFAVAAFAQNASPPNQFRLNPEEVTTARSLVASDTGSSGNSAVREVVIKGDPSKRELYTVLLEVGPNAKIAAHHHPDDRTATVISGTWFFGYGPKFDAEKFKQLPAGSVYSEPAGVDHFALTHGPVIVAITGFGPSGVTYPNPLDDPARRTRAGK